METVDLVQAADSSELSPKSSVRKMKQSRLLFQVISPGATSSGDTLMPSAHLGETRKRKPSSGGIEFVQVSKFGRVSATIENNTKDTKIKKNCIQGSKAVEETYNTGIDSVELSTELPSTSNSISNVKKSTKRYKKRFTKKHDSDKIQIKLPVGKRKRMEKAGTKLKNMRQNCTDVLNLNGTSREIIQLDDTDLSEEGEEYQTEKSTIVSETERSPNKLLISLEKKSEETPKRHNRHSKEPSQPVEISKESPLLVNIEKQLKTDGRTSLSVPQSDQRKKSGTFTLAMFFNKVEESNKKSDAAVCIISDEDSSEEDIYMLCTPNTKVVPTADDKCRKLTPKQMARRQDYEKRQTLKMQAKEEKRRKLLEEKEEKAREKEDQERQRKREREEKEEQKRKEREEKEEIKRKEREEKEEIKRKEREEKEEQKRKEREEKERKRQTEIEQKNGEKRQKEEDRRKKEEQREEERKRKEEEKEAEEKRKQKVAQAFTSFFVKKTSNGGYCKASDEENSIESSQGLSTATSFAIDQQRFMPFCVKGDMRLAPMNRKVLRPVQKENLQEVLTNQSGKLDVALKDLYLGLLKRQCHKPSKADRTWSVEEVEGGNDYIMIVDESGCHEIEENPGKKNQKLKAKFLLFDENRRPPFRGTWRKKSSCISARRPFALDTQYFDYEVDSDEEWEEEEPGESLHGSDDEKDVDPEEDYEVDNEFFVPHGHLSDEELQAEEEGGMDDNRPEVQKAKLKLMQQEFVAEMKKKTEKIKPRLIGCIWENVERSIGVDNIDGSRNAECSTIIWKLLNDRAMLYDDNEPISFTLSSSTHNGSGNGDDHDAGSSSPGKENEKGPKKGRITDEAVRDLVRLVHGNVNNRKFLVREFQAFWLNRNDAADSDEHTIELSSKASAGGNGVEFSLESIRNKIREIAEWGACPLQGPMMGKLCWIVDKHVLEQYDLQELNIPNCWEYQLKGNKQRRLKIKVPAKKEEDREHLESPPKKKGFIIRAAKYENDRSRKVPASAITPPMPDITKFTKVLSKDDRMNRFAVTKNLPKRSKTEDSSKEDVSGTVLEKELSATVFKGNNPLGQKKTKKRVQLLMSVPRGQTINQSTKNSLISQFLANGSIKTMKPLEKEKETECTKNKEVIEID